MTITYCDLLRASVNEKSAEYVHHDKDGGLMRRRQISMVSCGLFTMALKFTLDSSPHTCWIAALPGHKAVHQFNSRKVGSKEEAKADAV
jgi:hypothetical protein